jgi:hypothetical protein
LNDRRLVRVDDPAHGSHCELLPARSPGTRVCAHGGQH